MSTCCGGACISKKSTGLLTWKNPAETGKVFGGIVFSLISLKYFNIINLILRLSFYALILSAVAEYSGKLIFGTGFVTKFRPAYSNFFEKNAGAISGHISTYLKVAEQEIQHLIYAKDIEQTFKAALIAYFLYKLTSWISVFTLVLTSTILVFTLPIVYENNKEQIDKLIKEYTKILKLKTLELQLIAKEKSAPYLEKLGPVGAFIKAKLPKNRTASTTVDGASATPAVKTTEAAEPAAVSSGIDLPSVPTSKLSSTIEESEVDINKLESEIKKSQAEAQAAL